ncbi:HAMP domain-containing protein [Pararhodospirillum photometricum]|uniref:HAMP domain-containing protein n=1 Tax=Pararhodospirillum photometricum TaxID=1084 RepID=UPI0002D3EE1A|nr:methyl-accepting chemotaxis protein [Pararhodospirillum photometricum]
MILSKVSFRALSGFMVAILVLVGALFWVFAVGIQSKVSNTDKFWRAYQDATAPKGVALEKAIASLGYGGMIDFYKAYVLRKEEGLRADIQAAAGAVLGAIHDYRAAGPSPEEAQALDELQAVIQQYRRSTARIPTLIAQGADAQSIHQTLPIDDAPALAAIARLQSAVLGDKHGAAGQRSRTEILAQIRASLGFGGLIHLMRDCILNRDDNKVTDILVAIAMGRDGLEAYRTLGVTPREEEALAAIETVVAHYEEKVSGISGLFERGASAEAINDAMLIDDAPALEAFITLERSLFARFNEERDVVSHNLQEAKLLSYAIIGVALLSSTVMIALVVWIQYYRMVRPVRAITGTMRQMSDGDLGVTVPGLERGDEIGHMAGALEVFRNGLLHAEELKEAERRDQAQKAENTRRLEQLLRDFDLTMIGILESLGEADSSMKMTAENMTRGADATRHEAGQVSASAEHVTANVEAVASAAEELSSSIAEIGRQVAQASQVARRAVGETEGTAEKLHTLEEAAGRRGGAVGAQGQQPRCQGVGPQGGKTRRSGQAGAAVLQAAAPVGAVAGRDGKTPC